MYDSIPASVQLFLSADKLVPLDNAFSAGTDIPCRKKAVKTNELGVFLLAFAFWDLKQKGCIDLQLKKRKSFFVFDSTVLCVKRIENRPSSGGLESLIMDGLNEKEIEVQKLVNSILKEDHPWPHKIIINTVINHAIMLGFGKSEEIKGSMKNLFKGLNGNVNFIPQCEAIQPLESIFDDMNDQWSLFGRNSPQVNQLLLSSCRAGLNSRVMNHDDNGGD